MPKLLLGVSLWFAWSGSLPAWAAGSYFRYERSVVAPENATQACAVLDARIFPHAEPYLKDLRLVSTSMSGRQDSNGGDVPYAITLSEPVEQDTEEAQVLHPALSGRAISFDLKMPARPYSDVDLDLEGKDFIATAIVTAGGGARSLGEFTLFDLTSQHLGRGTTLHLAESSYPTLHVTLLVTPVGAEAARKPAWKPSATMVRGASVPPSRDAQSLFTTVAETSSITQQGNLSIARFTLPQRVPVERISIVLASEFNGNFSRTVRIEDRRAGDPESAAESIVGSIQRVVLEQAGRSIHQEQLSVVTTLGANLQGPSEVQVAVDNRGLPPVQIVAVRLEMRERRLCFDARLARGGATLFYGDPALSASRYAYRPIFAAADPISAARMGPEMTNPTYQARPSETLPLERRQQLLWAGMLIIVSTTAMAVFVSSKHHHHG